MVYVLMIWFTFGVTVPSKPVVWGGFLDAQACNAAAISFITEIKKSGQSVSERHVCVPNQIIH